MADATQPNTKPASASSASATPSTPSTPVKKKWADMNEAERAILKTTKLSLAVDAVKKGARPGLPIKVGDHTLTLRPTGVSEKGSVAYGYKPAIILFEGQRLRINKISFSLLNDHDTASDSVDWDSLAESNG